MKEQKPATIGKLWFIPHHLPALFWGFRVEGNILVLWTHIFGIIHQGVVDVTPTQIFDLRKTVLSVECFRHYYPVACANHWVNCYATGEMQITCGDLAIFASVAVLSHLGILETPFPVAWFSNI